MFCSQLHLMRRLCGSIWKATHKFRIYSAHPGSGVSLSSSNIGCGGGSGDHGHSDNRGPPTDSPHLPEQNHRPTVGNPTMEAEMRQEAAKIPNARWQPDIVTSSRVEFFAMDFAASVKGTPTPELYYQQNSASITIQTPAEHPNILSDERPLSSHSYPQPTPVQKFSIARRGIGWHYHVQDKDMQVGGLQLAGTPALLPLVHFAFRGRAEDLTPPDKLDITVLALWELPAQFCGNKPQWWGNVVSKFSKSERKIPIRTFAVEVRFEVPTDLTRGSFVDKVVEVGPDYVCKVVEGGPDYVYSVDLKQSVRS
ncbi:hypothetical protein BDZ89DRAFT_1058098 [Hymenopellis radicata]|nr:hypothetical protein BDZ89DRAFT_1058098 [Hymenopellis radicata]